MQLQHHIEALQADLAELGSLGDQTTAEAAQRLSLALRSAAGLRMLDALTEAALELSAQLSSGHVEVRMAGQDPQLVLVEDEAEPSGTVDDAALTARITLRIPEGLKAAVETMATQEGVSVNAWIVRALARFVGGGPAQQTSSTRGPGKRLTGYARS
jgi:signal-transduction protein with cAMP-binding, CBS, and nucleotidyltransferase domain